MLISRGKETNMPTSKKPLALLLLFLLFLGSIVFLVNEYKSEKIETSEAIYKETSELLADISAETNRFGNEREGELELIAKYIAVIGDDQDQLQSFLKEQNSKMPFLIGLGFIDPTGNILAADGSHLTIKERDSFERAMSGHMTTSDLFPLEQDPEVQVTAISVPVKKDGIVIGVLSGVVSLSDIIHQLINDSSLQGTVYLMKDDHLVYSSKEGITYSESKETRDLLTLALKESESGVIKESKEDAHYIFYDTAWNDWVTAVDSFGHPDMKKMVGKKYHYTFMGAGILLALVAIYFYILKLVNRHQTISHLDAMTGVGNILKLEEDGEYIQHKKKSSYTIILLNLREFKNINNWAGYESGNAVLLEVARRLTEDFEEKHTTYRVGGGEFVVMLTGSRTKEEAEAKTIELCEIIRAPIYIEGHEGVWLDVYAGIRHVGVHEEKTAQFLHDAVFACQEARELTEVPYAFFTEELESLSTTRKIFSKELSEALSTKEFKLVYQPIYSFKEDSIVSFETLLRWDSKRFGMVSPAQFIPLLEESGMIIPVGDWIIEEAAMQVGKWRAQGYPTLYVTVNVSVKQLLDEAFIGRVQEILAKTNTTPDSLVFEITESVVVEDSEKALQTVTKLNKIGISTALDDFGTGYSSLSILRLLPFQFLKVDKSFIDDMESRDSDAASVVKGILTIASGLQQVTIIEGVETANQLSLLKELGADRIQGYYFSKPVPPDEAFLLLS